MGVLSELTVCTTIGHFIILKMWPQTALGVFHREWFVRGSQSGTVGPTNLPNMTPLAASGRLQYAVKYCTKVR